MATLYSFQFNPVNSILAIKMYPAHSFKSDKDWAIVEKLLSIPEIVEDIINNLSSFLKFPSLFLSNLNNSQRIFLEHLIKKLSFKLPARREEEDDDEDCELSIQESEFMNKALEIFLTESSTSGLTFDEENKKVGDLIPESRRKAIIKIKLNILRGFSNPETPKGEEFESDKPGTLICMKHHTTTTHFCKTCNKLVCAFDMFPGKDAKEETCKNHELMTLLEYQASMEQRISGFVSKIEDLNTKCKQIIDSIRNEIEDLTSKKLQNEETKNNLEELSKKMKSILSMKATSNSQVFDVFYEKLEEMMKIETEFNSKFQKMRIIKNPKDEEIELFQKRIEDEMTKLRNEFSNKKKEFENEKNELICKHKKEIGDQNNENNEIICKLQNEIEDQKNKFEKETKEKEQIKKLENERIEIISKLKKENEEFKKEKEAEKEQKLIEKAFKDLFSIASPQQMEILKKFVEQTIGITDLSQWKLLYKATKDGFGAKDFHSHCDSANRTLVIIKSTNGSIFGGFTTKRWDSGSTTNTYVRDDSAFIFSIFCATQPNRDPKRCSATLRPQCAINCYQSFGPIFGGGNDIVIYDSSNTTTSYTNFNHTYDAGLKEGSEEAKNYLCGSYSFLTLEIEVYTM